LQETKAWEQMKINIGKVPSAKIQNPMENYFKNIPISMAENRSSKNFQNQRNPSRGTENISVSGSSPDFR
jgi:hypothetical protein